MTEDNIIRKPRYPHFKGDGVAVWVNRDKNNKQYLSIRILNKLDVVAFRNAPRDRKPEPGEVDYEE